MEPTTQQIQEIKDTLEKDHGREFTWEEATKAARDLHTLVHISIEIAEEEFRRRKLLKDSPKGFHFDRKGYTCLLCDHSALGEDSWYDKYGLKCMTCQKAINQKIIPGSVVKDKESWYSKFDLEVYFNIKGPLLKKYIKEGVLKDRIIPDEGKKIHLQLFLLTDNKEFLPPKNLLQARTIKVEHNGEEYYTSEQWYEYIDLDRFEKLKKYKIVNYLAETFSNPIETGRLLYKQLNPLFRDSTM